MSLLKKISQQSTFNLMPERDATAFDDQVKDYVNDLYLNETDAAVPIDEWWGAVDEKKYKALLSCFHGPLVEGAVSMMAGILDKYSTQMDIETYSSMSFVKNALNAQETEHPSMKVNKYRQTNT